jgi:hypothetical protein
LDHAMIHSINGTACRVRYRDNMTSLRLTPGTAMHLNANLRHKTAVQK